MARLWNSIVKIFVLNGKVMKFYSKKKLFLNGKVMKFYSKNLFLNGKVMKFYSKTFGFSMARLWNSIVNFFVSQWQGYEIL